MLAAEPGPNGRRLRRSFGVEKSEVDLNDTEAMCWDQASSDM